MFYRVKECLFIPFDPRMNGTDVLTINTKEKTRQEFYVKPSDTQETPLRATDKRGETFVTLGNRGFNKRRGAEQMFRDDGQEDNITKIDSQVDRRTGRQTNRQTDR